MRRWIALVVAMVFPTLAAWVYFDLLAGSPALAPTYLGCKLVQAALPLVAWRWATVRRHPAWNRDGLPAGLLFGTLAAFAILVGYRLLADGLSLADAASRIANRLAAFGATDPPGFVVVALLLSIAHSLFEEYYWRWFLYRGLADAIAPAAAIFVSGLAFAAHHVIVVRELLGAPLWLAAVVCLFVATAGWVWAWLFHRWSSLSALWLSHAIVDGAIMVVGYRLLWG